MASLINLIIFLWVFAAIVWGLGFLLQWKLPYLIGRSGEKFVFKRLLSLNQEHYKVLNDLMLPSLGNLTTTQIDHVVVSNYGIFVIETKSYKGWIFGTATQRWWTQVIYRYKKKFYNPLWQNYAHTKAIEALVRPLFPNIPIIGFVAFPSAGKLKITGTDAVGHARDVISKIEGFTAPVISDTELSKIVEVLTQSNILDKEARKLHNKNAHALRSTNNL